MDMQNNYSFDANVLITISLDRYPRDIFPSFWIQLEKFIDSWRLKVIEFVWREVKGNSGDDFKSFEDKVCVKIQDLSSEEQEEIQGLVVQILTETPTILDSNKNQIKSWGDPWIVAHWKLHDITIVSEERSDPIKKNKVPDICNKMDVRCIKLLEFLRELGWKM